MNVYKVFLQVYTICVSHSLVSSTMTAECGDFVDEDYPDHRYLSLYKFVPSQDPELEKKIMDNHKKHM